MTTTATTGRSASTCRSPRCIRTATTWPSWSSTCSSSRRVSRSSSPFTTTRPAGSAGQSWSSPVSSSSWRACYRCTPSSRGPASTLPSTSARRRISAASGRSTGTPGSAATPSRGCSPNWSAASRRRRRSSGRSDPTPTSWCGSPRLTAGTIRPVRHCPPSCCCGPRFRTPPWTASCREATSTRFTSSSPGTATAAPSTPCTSTATRPARRARWSRRASGRSSRRTAATCRRRWGASAAASAANRWPSPSCCSSITCWKPA